MDLLNSWQFYVIISLFCEVIFTQNYKLAVQKAKNDGAATVLMEIIAGASLLLLIPFFPFLIPTNFILYLFLGLSTLFAAIQDRLKTTGRKILPASEAAILNELTSAFLIIIGFTIFHQKFIVIKFIGAVLILMANALLLSKTGKFVINKGVFLFLIACMSLSIAFSLDIGFSSFFNIPLYISITYILSAAFIFFTNRLQVKNVIAEFLPKQRKYYILTGIAWGILGFSIIRAAQTGPIIIVIPLISLSVLANVITTTLVHKEKSDLQRKIISAIIIMLGVTLTVLY